MEIDYEFQFNGLQPILLQQGFDFPRLSNLLQRPVMVVSAGAPTHTEDGVLIRKLFVSNIPSKATRTELNTLFSKFGKIKGTWVHGGMTKGKSSGRPHYAFVTFIEPEDAHKALKANMKELQLHGRNLRLSPADSWHQPVEDEHGVMLWKTSRRHHYRKGIDTEHIPQTDGAEMSGENDSATILDILNHYCLNAVLGYLPFRDLVRSELVCKRWRDNVRHIYKTIHTFKTDDWCLQHGGVTTAVLRNLLRKIGPYLRTLEVNGNLGVYNERTANTIGKHCPNLINLELSSMKISNWLPLMKLCTLLESITFSNCEKLTDNSLTSLFKENSKLRSLNVTASNNLTGSFLLATPQDKRLSALALNACFRLQGHALMSGIRAMPTITHLQLEVCSRKVLRFIPDMLKCLPELTSLEVSEVGAYSLTSQDDDTLAADLEEALGLVTQMQRLRLRWYLVTDKTLFAIAANMPKLTFLDVAGCNGYDKINQSKQIGVTDRGIQKLIRSCVSLQTLDISHVTGVSVDAVHALTGLPRLTALRLRGNKNISDAGYIAVLKSCHELELLEVCGGELVTSDVIRAASKALYDRPPHLRKPLRLALIHTNALTEDADLPKDLHPLLHIDTEEPADRQPGSLHMLHSTSDEDSDDDSYDFDISGEEDYEDFFEHRFALGVEDDEFDADILEQLEWGLYPE